MSYPAWTDMDYPAVLTRGKNDGTGGLMNDCNLDTDWTLYAGGSTATRTVDSGDYLKLNVTVYSDDVYVRWNPADVGVGPNKLNKRFMVRYKCSNATIKAKVRFVYVEGPEDEQNVMAATNNETFTIYDSALAADYTLKYVDLFACDTTGYVLWDHILVYENVFNFPDATRVSLNLPEPRSAILKPPGRSGNISQNLGSEMATVDISADMEDLDGSGAWGDPIGEVFDQISHEMKASVWQWLWLPKHKRKFKVEFNGAPHILLGNQKFSLTLPLREYKLGATDAQQNFAERFGHS